ncbi:MAG TPA: limonene-1,2-epoxide hydrolase family protein [Polyangiaceae bacterium]|jgi:limonene-1,2-epoxide hydrolase
MHTEPSPSIATPTSPIDVVESFLSALQAKDLDRAASLMAEDITYQNVPFPADRGKRAVLRTLRAFQRVVTGFEVRMHHIAERDGVVLTERVDVLTGPLVYLDIWVCGTFEVKGGRVTLWRDYFDLAECTGKLLVGPIRKLLRRGR